MKVSTLILTYNEAANIARCLDALAWCDDVVVFDSGSTDRTVELARAHGARVISRPFDTFANQRNFGLEAGDLRHEWVLHLDADEVITPQFTQALSELAPAPGIFAYRVPCKVMLFEHWLRFASMYPTYQVRLGRRDRLRFKQVGHGQREDLPPERIGTFSEPYLHYNFSHGLVAWLHKHVRYAEDEARLIRETRAGRSPRGPADGISTATDRRRALKRLSARVPLVLRPPARFLYVLIWHRGFRDGGYGLLYALMLSVYEGMIAILTYELVEVRTADKEMLHSPDFGSRHAEDAGAR